jgi:hypothetical protein
MSLEPKHFFKIRRGPCSVTISAILIACIDDYRKEIDENLMAEEKARRAKVAEAFPAANTPGLIRAGGFQSRFAQNRVFAGGWHIVEGP